METLNLQIPLEYHVEIHDGKEYHMLFSNDETKKYIDIPIVVQKNTKEDAIKTAYIVIKSHLDYLEERSKVADKYEWFRLGPKTKSSIWFMIFGINFYFRYGKGMKNGWYVPFTNLNIMITNHWKKK